MINAKKVAFGLLALLFIWGNLPLAESQSKNQPVKQNQPPAPIVVEGDKLSFSDLTGDLYAEGKVKVTQADQVLLADLIQGNTKQSEMWIDGSSTFIQPDVKLVGNGLRYNYHDRVGKMLNAKGMVTDQRVAGENINFFPEQVIIHNGTVTRCPAKVPDYHVSASRVEIWPGDKMIAYNAKLWIKNVVILTLPKYQTSLKKNEGESEFPRFGYNNSTGFFIKEYVEEPVSGRLAAYVDLDYYTKSKFKPNYGLIDRENAYDLKLVGGNFIDDDDNWIKKEPELNLKLHRRSLGNLPVHYTFSAAYGKWKDHTKTSWHQDYTLYFSRDPIKFGKGYQLDMGAGLEWIHESYDDSINNTFKYDVTLSRQWSSRWNSWVGYHYTGDNNTLFDFDRADLGRELDTGFSYKIDDKNTIAFNQSYDMVNNHVYDQDYTWYRNLHCWEAAITYRARRHEVKVDFSVIRW